MKKLLSLGVLSLLIGMNGMTLSGKQNGGGRQGSEGQFIGAWRLAALEEQGSDGAIHRADCTGLLVYTSDGHMSVQVMYRDLQTASNQYAQGGYEASFGTYRIDERAHTFSYHVEGALVRSLIGQDQTRVYEFSGQQLIVKSSNPDEHWKVTWERY